MRPKLVEGTFIHLPGIGPRTEKNIWRQGIDSWGRFRDASRIKGISRKRKAAFDELLRACTEALDAGTSEDLIAMFPCTEQWRLYRLLALNARFIDIETDGLSHNCSLTVFGVARPENGGLVYSSLIRGISLTRTEAKKALDGASALVTFNGSSFDLPVIRRELGDILPKVPHIDLRYLARRAGLSGGLKALESRLGIVRDAEVQMIAGNDAVRLWSVWKRKRHKRALEILVDYNREDVVNLAPLAQVIYRYLEQRLLARMTEGTK
jgi:uncharacterized protein YprB with RNaseH-like and TPR domain